MKIEYITFTNDLTFNRKALSADGAKCVYCGGMDIAKLPSVWEANHIRLAVLDIPFAFHFGTMEVFENGRVNLMIRNTEEKVLGFLKFIPDNEKTTTTLSFTLDEIQWLRDCLLAASHDLAKSACYAFDAGRPAGERAGKLSKWAEKFAAVLNIKIENLQKEDANYTGPVDSREAFLDQHHCGSVADR